MTTPLPTTVAVAGVEVEDASGVLVDAEHPAVVGHLRLQGGQAPLAQVAEPGVVGAALGVVVVGDDRHVGTEHTEQVEPVGPHRVGADLVDLVHRARCSGPSVRAAALANTTHPPWASLSASRSGTSVPAHWRRA